MVIVGKGDFIWIEPQSKSAFSCPVGARVLESDIGRIRVRDDEGNEQWLGPERRIKLMHPTSVQGVEDMIQLGDLHESGILRTLHVRYNEKLIYTYTGSILVAVNPYQVLPIYTADQIQLYKDKRIGILPPHIFAIADNAYNNMKKSRKDQCIIISGESGAGKTESTKLVLQFLAATSGQHTWIEQQVLEANPIMEAFGNAKTVRNDNSSRFGKYVDIHFNSAGAIEGAKIEQYLLEKSRIVSQAHDERNYHIFYCLLAGLQAKEKKELELGDASHYFYLTQGRSLLAEGRDDAADFADIRAAMKVLLFNDQEIWSTFKILAALLHTGNIQYSATSVNGMDATEIADRGGVERVAALLDVAPRRLVDALTTRTIVTRDERVVSSMTAEQSLDIRDAFVKGVYGKLFVWIVHKLNQAIFKPKKEGATRKSIGVLDIFGFENFDSNSFEQLCINFANETLQQFFVQHAFRMEQADYEAECIDWRRIEFSDNRDTLDLIAVRPLNIVALMDEESKFPKGTDQTWLNKMHQTHNSDRNYLKPKSDLNKSFGINHYAGVVFYNSRGFLEKNRDTFSADLLALVHGSKFKFLVNLFDGESLADEDTRKRKTTVGSQFRKSLDCLMLQLDKCQPFFIRCVKPNELKKPMVFDRELCCKQLRYSGMMETIRIRKSGYPIRHDYTAFVSRFRILCSGIGPIHKIDCKSAAAKICQKSFGPKADFQVGKTKVFLKESQDLWLEQERERVLERKAVVIQKSVRGWLQRRRFNRQRAAAVVVQKHWRTFAQKRRYRRVQLGIARLQALIRTRQLVCNYHRIRSVMVQFQALCRGRLLRDGVRAKRAQGERHIHMTEEEVLQQRMTINDGGFVNGTADDVDDSKLVEQMFGFLPSDSSSATEATETGESPEGRRRFDDLAAPPTTATAAAADMDSRVLPERRDDLDGFHFAKFAATYFQASATAAHLRRPLRHPLLPHDNTGDQIAALAVWITILRFMGDLPEPKNMQNGGTLPTNTRDNTPVMAKLYSTLGRNFSKKDLEYAQQAAEFDSFGSEKIRKGSVRQKLISLTLKKKSKLSSEVVEQLKKEDYGENYNALLENRPTTNLEKLHFIIGHGILRPDLRDEIYAQICKQLTNNPSRSSHARGWILLSLCVGCFAPSERFVKYLRCFIRASAPPLYDAFCEERLSRTLLNGTRHQPPSHLELQATKSKKALILPITFMDGATRTLLADSATTAKELCQSLCDKIGLKEQFGFSLYIALYDKVSSLGSGSDHVLDAVSQCEQYARERGGSERAAPWRLFFRKEIFAPWHSTTADPVATELVFQQIVRGVKYGEYRCEKEDDLAMLAARQYFVEFGTDLNTERMRGLLPSYIPDFVLSPPNQRVQSANQKSHIVEKWLQLVLHAYRKTFQGKSTIDTLKLKEETVAFAKFRWPLLFSRFYEAYKFDGPPLPKNEVIIAVNWTGVYIVDDEEQVLLELSFPEILGIACTQTGRVYAESVSLQTVRGEEFAFRSTNAEDIRELVEYFLVGLKRRSKYLIALQECRADVDSSRLSFRRGDLLSLEGGGSGEAALREAWLRAENVRTGAAGDVASEHIYVLPTITKPSSTILELFLNQAEGGVKPKQSQELVLYSPVEKPHTMELFAVENFRPAARRSSTLQSARRQSRRGEEELWRHGREPLRAPLLRRLVAKEEVAAHAVAAFLAILKYMGDHPTPPAVRHRLSTDLTDQIFTPPLKYEILRDEIYCQLMKQLTLNPNGLSEERGWELFWLAVGLFPPSPSLQKEVAAFLKSRRHQAALDCLARLQKIQRSGQRKYAPHQVEVEAVQHKTTQIFHKIYFPDDTDEAIEVDSCTRARDLCQKIANRLALKSADGFSLFVKIADKVISVPENEFFFDFVRELTEWVKKMRPTREGVAPQFTYQVRFLKKLWTHTVPGKDRNADIIFHYHQEVPKYLLGYHQCSREEAVELAALIYRAKYGADASKLQHISSLLPQLVPKDMTKAFSNSDWKKVIGTTYGSDRAGLSSEEARVRATALMGRWATFGSAFFDVRQSSDPSLPDRLLVAINRHGLSLIHPNNKEIIFTYPFTKISNWTSGNTYFHVNVGNLMKGTRLLLETSLGYKMDDLLTSYISQMLASMNKTSAANPSATHL